MSMSTSTSTSTSGVAIDGIERFESPNKGRGLRVSRSFRVGELLFSCPPYTHVLSATNRGHYCDFCLNRKESLARCGKCKKAHYCNVKCQKSDWAAHKLECSAMLAFGDKWGPSESSRLVARILDKKQTQTGRSASERILLVGDMQSHAEDAPDKSQADAGGLHRFYSKHLDFPDSKELLGLFSQVKTLTRKHKGGKRVTRVCILACGQVSCNGFTIEDEELSHVGTAVYPDVALINHSCDPNVMVTFNGSRADVRAVKDVKAGQEVLTSYIDLLYPTDERNDRLSESYRFTCDCAECRSGAKDELKLKVRKRGASAETVNASLRHARKTIRHFRELKRVQNILFNRKPPSVWTLDWNASLDSWAPPSELLETCERSLEDLGPVLDDANVYMLHIKYQAMGVCVYQGELQAAVRYGEKLLTPFRPAFLLSPRIAVIHVLSSRRPGKENVALEMRLNNGKVIL
ncbi:N-lysine methyltransferase SMYD2-A-like isoform X1 [Vanacampus margaritifer]